MDGTVDGLQYQYSEGDGRPLVFLHGWLGSQESWQQVIEHLDPSNPVLCYDQRCHGRSSCEPFTLASLANDLATVLDHLEIDDPVLAGHSMGGMVALAYTARHGSPDSLFLAGTCATTPTPVEGSPRSFRERLDTMDRSAWADAIAANYCPTDDELREMARRELEEADRDVLQHGLEAFEQFDVRDRIQDDDTHSIVLSGARDRAVTQEKTQELADLLAAPHITLDTSHLMLQECPVRIAGMLSEFVAETRPDNHDRGVDTL